MPEPGTERPCVVLLDARDGGEDEPGLRTRARAVSAAAGAAHVVRSYRYPYAVVASYAGPVGVDIERVAPYDAVFAASIQTPRERAAVPEAGDPAVTVAVLWSGKEALAKALGDALAYDPRRLDGPGSWPGGRAGPWHAERIAAPEGHVGWLCWRPA